MHGHSNIKFINGTLKCDYNYIILIIGAIIKKGNFIC